MNNSVRQRPMDEWQRRTTSNVGQQQTKDDIKGMRCRADEGINIG